MEIKNTKKKNGIKLTEKQKIKWLQLARCENVGPATFKQLIQTFGTAEKALEEMPEMIKKVGARKIKIAKEDETIKEYEEIKKIGGQVICIGEPEYPKNLRNAEGSPTVISVIGDCETLGKNCVAFVGSRNASVAGVKMTAQLAQDVGNAGYVTVSGIARGIDAAAHKASVKTGTVAVFAGGIDHVYPQENEELAKEIVENGGCLVSETPFGWKPRAQDFPRRNRIVAGLAMAVVVVEAAQQSGSLISAKLAAEMGRLVLAVPGSPLDPRSVGANNLIREGATLINNAQEIIDELKPINEEYQEDIMYNLHETVRENDELMEGETAQQNHFNAIQNALDFTPISVDEIIRHTGCSTEQVVKVLLAMQMAGEIERHPGNKVSKLQNS